MVLASVILVSMESNELPVESFEFPGSGFSVAGVQSTPEGDIVTSPERSGTLGPSTPQQVWVPLGQAAPAWRLASQSGRVDGDPVVIAGRVEDTSLALLVFEAWNEVRRAWDICHMVWDTASPGGGIGCAVPDKPGLAISFGPSWPSNVVWGPLPEQVDRVLLEINGRSVLQQQPSARHVLFVVPIDRGSTLRLTAFDIDGQEVETVPTFVAD